MEFPLYPCFSAQADLEFILELSCLLFQEFLLSVLAHIEELPNMTSDDGISLTQITLWVKKGCWGVRTEGFNV
jgi:hypothetical protein